MSPSWHQPSFHSERMTSCFPGIWNFIREWSLCLFLPLPKKAAVQGPRGLSFLAPFTPAHTPAPGLGCVPVLLWVPAWWPCRYWQCWPLTHGLQADKPWRGPHLPLGLLGWSGMCVRACMFSASSLMPSHQILHSPDWILLSSLSRCDCFLLNAWRV